MPTCCPRLQPVAGDSSINPPRRGMRSIRGGQRVDNASAIAASSPNPHQGFFRKSAGGHQGDDVAASEVRHGLIAEVSGTRVGSECSALLRSRHRTVPFSRSRRAAEQPHQPLRAVPLRIKQPLSIYRSQRRSGDCGRFWCPWNRPRGTRANRLGASEVGWLGNRDCWCNRYRCSAE